MDNEKNTQESINNELAYAICENNIKKVRRFIELGTDVNNKSRAHGMTPLLLAIEHECEEILSLLLNAGAEVNTESNKDLPLCSAIIKGNTLMVTSLLEAGAEVNLADGLGFTPLFLALGGGYDEIQYLLLNAGADIDLPSMLGRAPIHTATDRGDDELLSFFVNLGADIYLPTKLGKTPIDLAEEIGNEKKLALLKKVSKLISPELNTLIKENYPATQKALRKLIISLDKLSSELYENLRATLEKHISNASTHSDLFSIIQAHYEELAEEALKEYSTKVIEELLSPEKYGFHSRKALAKLLVESGKTEETIETLETKEGIIKPPLVYLSSLCCCEKLITDWSEGKIAEAEQVMEKIQIFMSFPGPAEIYFPAILKDLRAYDILAELMRTETGQEQGEYTLESPESTEREESIEEESSGRGVGQFLEATAARAFPTGFGSSSSDSSSEPAAESSAGEGSIEEENSGRSAFPGEQASEAALLPPLASSSSESEYESSDKEEDRTIRRPYVSIEISEEDSINSTGGDEFNKKQIAAIATAVCGLVSFVSWGVYAMAESSI